MTLDAMVPPQNLEAERGVLGAVLREPDALPDVRAALDERAFYLDAHRRVFRAMLAAADAGRPPDLVSVRAELKRAGDWEEVGGVAYLTELWDSAANAAYVEHHAALVRDAAACRGLIHACTETLRDAYSGGLPAADLLAAAERRVFELNDRLHGAAADLRPVGDVLREAVAAIEERMAAGGGLGGLATGYPDLDDLLGGLRPGELVVVGARPSVGKTAFGLNVAVNAATRGEPVAFFSCEMPAAQIAGRLLAMGSGVSMHRLSRGVRLSPEEMGRLTQSSAELGGCGLYLDDAPDLSAARLASVLRRAVRRHGVSLAVVDYLQIMRPENPRDNRTQQVGTLARRLMQAARECGVPILCLCQLNREVEGRNGGRPRLADLRESGEIEQHANAVLLLHRPDGQPDEAECITIDVLVAKNRNGPTGDVTLAYRRPVMRYESYAPVPRYA